MAENHTSPQTVPHPGRVKQNYRSMSGKDIVLIIVGAIVALTSLIVWGKIQAFGVALVVTLLLRRTQHTRLYRLPALKLCNLYYHCLHGVLWTAERSWTDFFRPRTPIPLRLGLLPDTRVGKETALIHNSRTGTDGIGITGLGSPIASLSYDAQVEATDRIADIDRRLAFAAGRLTVGKSLVFRRGPVDMAAVSAMMDNTYNGNVLYPRFMYLPAAEMTDEDRRYAHLHALMIEGLEVVEDWAGEILTGMMVTIQQPGILKAASKKGLGDKAADRLLVVNLAEVAVEGLARAGISSPTVMNLETAHACMRNAFDVADNYDYNKWRMSGPSMAEIASSDNLFPRERIVVHSNYCQIDNSFHTVFKLIGTPEDVAIFHMRRLLSTQVSYPSVALVGEAVKSTGEYAILDRALTFIPYLQEFFGTVQQGPKQRAREERLTAQRERAFESQYVVRYQVYVSVSSDSLAGLEADAIIMRQRLDELNLSYTRIRDASLQVRALYCATTGSNLL